MADKDESALSKKLLDIDDLPGGRSGLVEEVKSPAFGDELRKLGKAVAASMVEQRYQCPWATLIVKRENHRVTTKWDINVALTGFVEKYEVSGAAYEIDFVPDGDNLSGGLFITTTGNGSASIELEEGISYHFIFIFRLKKQFRTDNAAKESDSISFQVAIPLSDERKKLLKQALLLEQHPAERIKDKLRMDLKLQNAFDEMESEALKSIKAQELSPDEEERRIELFRARAEKLKDDCGM